MSRIPVDQAQLEAFCQRYHIRRLALFGSVLGNDFRPESDVDVLVEFEPGCTPGFLALATMERELSPILGGRTVDLQTPQSLSRYFRDDVMQAADVHYAAS